MGGKRSVSEQLADILQGVPIPAGGEEETGHSICSFTLSWEEAEEA